MSNTEPTAEFALLTSQLVDYVVSQQGAELQPNLEALRLLADAVEVTLPEEPRVALLGPDQIPHTDDYIILRDGEGYVPKVQADDLVVNIRDFRNLTEKGITESIATKLATVRLASRNRRGRWLSGAVTMAGVGGDAVHQFGHVTGTIGNVLNYGSLGIMTLGLAGVGYFSSREKVHLPKDLHDMPPPVQLVPRTET